MNGKRKIGAISRQIDEITSRIDKDATLKERQSVRRQRLGLPLHRQSVLMKRIVAKRFMKRLVAETEQAILAQPSNASRRGGG